MTGLHDRKIRRRIKAAIRHTPSKPLSLHDHQEEEGGEDDDERDTIQVINRPTTRPALDVVDPRPSTTTVRKRKGNVGLSLMANFKSDSLARGKRMTLVQRDKSTRFLGGLKVSSGKNGMGARGRSGRST